MEEIIEKNITRGGEFVIKESRCDEVFTPEDFSEEQKMMRDAVKEFADKEIWSKKEEFENLGSKVLSISRKEGVDINNTDQVDEFLLKVDKVDFLINVASINYTKKIQEIIHM